MLDASNAAAGGKLQMSTSSRKNNRAPKTAQGKKQNKPHPPPPQNLAHGKKHNKIHLSPPTTNLLGSTKSGQFLDNSQCGNYCNLAAGSQCVAISGGADNTPQCTCTTNADCQPSAWIGALVQNASLIGCQEYYPTAPNNYKNPICCYSSQPVHPGTSRECAAYIRQSGH